MEIGVDIEKNERFKNISKHFLERVYTKNEILYAQKFKNPHEHFCAMWCLKEATVKAFSNLKIPFLEIELSVAPDGKPMLVKNETILNELKRLNLTDIKISLSHSKDYSTAVCLIY